MFETDLPAPDAAALFQARTPAPAYLTALALGNFRNHRETRLNPGRAPIVLLTGANGAGKTNILEAVSLLSVGRGLRGSALSAMAMSLPDEAGAPGFRIQAELSVEPDLPPVELHTGTQPPMVDRRGLKVNGAAAPLSTLSQWLSVLWATPAMDRLFSEGASGRRRFLDRLVHALDPLHAGHASRYEAAMRARNRLLAERGMRADRHWLTALEAEMAEHGQAMANARARAVNMLTDRLQAETESPFPHPSLALEGGCADALTDALRSARHADVAAGRATIGPHRQDLVVHHAAKAMPAGLSSTGEQKGMLLAILLAHAALVATDSGRTPILLLDEAAAHLDADRRHALIGRLLALGGQSWLSGTDPGLFETDEAARYSISCGAVSQA